MQRRRGPGVPLASGVMRIALVSRELYPYSGGGIAPVVAAEARILRELGEVVVVTSAAHRQEHERLCRAGDPRVPPDDIELVFVEEPPETDHGAFMSWMHAWSSRIHSALVERYGDRGPDLIEFCDYLAEGFVTIQAAHSRAAWLEPTCVCVRLHTTSELCAVLDGFLPDDFATTVTHDMERYCLRHADRLLHVGGDVLPTYARYYGADNLAPGALTPDGFFAYGDEEADTARRTGDRLKLLYVGRMERRKGVQNLIRAVTSLERDDVTLTMLGGDTMTAPLQRSLREQLMLMAENDERISFAEPIPRAEVPRFVRDHDVTVLPSLWECWPNTAREALMFNRPILCTPVGGLVRMARPGVSGWLTKDTGVAALAREIDRLADAREEVEELIAQGGPRRVFEELSDPADVVAAYDRLLRGPRPRVRRGATTTPPLVSVIVPYFRLDETLEETLDSIAAQTHRPIETVIVNDGSLRPQDGGVFDALERPGVTVVTQANSGLGAARNLGVSQARGAFILPLDADDRLHPEFLERCLRPLLADPDLAYCGTWVEYMDQHGSVFTDEDGGYMPLGNFSRRMPLNNTAGTCSVLFRREVFDQGFRYSVDLTSYEDWFLFWELHRAGRLGVIAPERLFQYRVRRDSMAREIGTPQVQTLTAEMRAHMIEREVRWTHELGVTSERFDAAAFPTVPA